MNENPYFNVIIPTRERADTLYHCLRTVVEQDYEHLKIIVSDNSSLDNTRDIVASFRDERVVYINTGKRLGMSQNWEFALDHVDKGWVTFLGDDDGLLPGCLSKVADVINKTKCDAIATKWAHYFWPGCNIEGDLLRVPVTRGFEVRNSKQWLAKLLNGSALYRELPMLYTGAFVKKSIIDAARAPGGVFFTSMTPDVYSAIAIASVTTSYVMLNEACSLCGVSRHSNGASWLGITGDSAPIDKYYSEDNIKFHPLLSSNRLRSLSILIYEAYLQASHLHSNTLNISLIDQLNLALRLATREDFYSTVAYCNDTAALNHLPISFDNRKRPLFRPHVFKRQSAHFANIFQELRFGPEQIAIKNVHEASIVCNALITFNRLPYWRLTNAMKWARSFVAALYLQFFKKK